MAEKKEVSADKLKVLNAVLDKIEKDFGKGAVMRMSSDKVEEVAVIPSGSITWIWPSEWEAIPKAESWRYSAPNRRVRRPWRCTP